MYHWNCCHRVSAYLLRFHRIKTIPDNTVRYCPSYLKTFHSWCVPLYEYEQLCLPNVLQTIHSGLQAFLNYSLTCCDVTFACQMLKLLIKLYILGSRWLSLPRFHFTQFLIHSISLFFFDTVIYWAGTLELEQSTNKVYHGALFTLFVI